MGDTLARCLLYTFAGYSTSFTPPNPEDNGTQLLQRVMQGAVQHRVVCYTLAEFVAEYLNFDIAPPLEQRPANWRSFSEQCLRTITFVPVYANAVGLNDLRECFRYYPRDVWLYLLGAPGLICQHATGKSPVNAEAAQEGIPDQLVQQVRGHYRVLADTQLARHSRLARIGAPWSTLRFGTVEVLCRYQGRVWFSVCIVCEALSQRSDSRDKKSKPTRLGVLSAHLTGSPPNRLL